MCHRQQNIKIIKPSSGFRGSKLSFYPWIPFHSLIFSRTAPPLTISTPLHWWLKQASTHRQRERTLRANPGSEAKQMFCQIYWLSEVGGATQHYTHTDTHTHQRCGQIWTNKLCNITHPRIICLPKSWPHGLPLTKSWTSRSDLYPHPEPGLNCCKVFKIVKLKCVLRLTNLDERKWKECIEGQ